MPFAPQTWASALAVQAIIQGFTVTDSMVTNASPFTAFSAADAAKYGNSGNATNAIYIGFPKDITDDYIRQCHIVVNYEHEHVYRRSLTSMSGGKTWDEMLVYIRFCYYRGADWYTAQKDLMIARDAFYPLLIKHAELPGAPTVQASRPETAGGSAPVGQHFSQMLGLDWLCWGFTWWMRQEWTAQGGIVP